MHVTYIYLHTERAYKENILLCAMRVHDVTCGTVRRRWSSRRSRCPVRERIQNWKKCFCRNRLPYSILNTYTYNDNYSYTPSFLSSFFTLCIFLSLSLYAVPNASHSSGVLQSYSVLSNTSSGRKEGKVGEGVFPPLLLLLLMSDLDVVSATGIRSPDVIPFSFSKLVMS